MAKRFNAKEAALYSCDNGAVYCGAHLGMSAKATGRDISGQRIEELRGEEAESFSCERCDSLEREALFSRLLCSACGKHSRFLSEEIQQIEAMRCPKCGSAHGLLDEEASEIFSIDPASASREEIERLLEFVKDEGGIGQDLAELRRMAQITISCCIGIGEISR